MIMPAVAQISTFFTNNGANPAHKSDQDEIKRARENGISLYRMTV